MKLFPFSRFTVSGNSMFPTLKQGQNVLVWCWFGKPKIGDIVVIRKENLDMVKRVSKIDDRHNNVFVVGDNLDKSTDSRNFGPISTLKIVGKVILVVR